MSHCIQGAWRISPTHLLKWRGYPRQGTINIMLESLSIGRVTSRLTILTALPDTCLTLEWLTTMASSMMSRLPGEPSPTSKFGWNNYEVWISVQGAENEHKRSDG